MNKFFQVVIMLAFSNRLIKYHHVSAELVSSCGNMQRLCKTVPESRHLRNIYSARFESLCNISEATSKIMGQFMTRPLARYLEYCITSTLTSTKTIKHYQQCVQIMKVQFVKNSITCMHACEDFVIGRNTKL